MFDYKAPIRDMRFVIHELIGEGPASPTDLALYSDCDTDLIDAVLEEAAKFAEDILSPVNRAGDTHGAKWEIDHNSHGTVLTAPGFVSAYQKFTEGGWMALPYPTEFGGQGLPRLLAVAISEMWKSANLSFSHVITLTHGAIDALLIAGSEELKATYLPRLVSGQWTGTMNITEPQAGSDLAAITCQARPQKDGTYRLFGQKIFITYGDHDMAENIIHLVLARTPNAPLGTKGLSLFLVPKFILDHNGEPSDRNDVYCTSIEHKLGVRGSPTTTLIHGDHGGSTGYLVGDLGSGLQTMFFMMNSARLSVVTESLGVAQRAWQMASMYAKERIQGTDATQKKGPSIPIVRHPDVRRLLMTQRSHTEAIRALSYLIAALQDTAHHATGQSEREAAARRIELLTPVLKGWASESAIELTSMAIQVFGGMGFIEETGVSQCLRDVRITSIYEGTTAIQAADLVGRKILRDTGHDLNGLIDEMVRDQKTLEYSDNPILRAIALSLKTSLAHLQAASTGLIEKMLNQHNAGLIVAEPFLRLMGTVLGGWQMGRAAQLAAESIRKGSEDPFYPEKITVAKFYCDHLLPQTAGLMATVLADNSLLLDLEDDAF